MLSIVHEGPSVARIGQSGLLSTHPTLTAGVGDSVGVRVVGSAVDGAEVLGSEVALVSSTAEFRWNV